MSDAQPTRYEYLLTPEEAELIQTVRRIGPVPDQAGGEIIGVLLDAAGDWCQAEDYYNATGEPEHVQTNREDS